MYKSTMTKTNNAKMRYDTLVSLVLLTKVAVAKKFASSFKLGPKPGLSEKLTAYHESVFMNSAFSFMKKIWFINYAAQELIKYKRLYSVGDGIKVPRIMQEVKKAFQRHNVNLSLPDDLSPRAKEDLELYFGYTCAFNVQLYMTYQAGLKNKDRHHLYKEMLKSTPEVDHQVLTAHLAVSVLSPVASTVERYVTAVREDCNLSVTAKKVASLVICDNVEFYQRLNFLDFQKTMAKLSYISRLTNRFSIKLPLIKKEGELLALSAGNLGLVLSAFSSFSELFPKLLPPRKSVEVESSFTLNFQSDHTKLSAYDENNLLHTSLVTNQLVTEWLEVEKLSESLISSLNILVETMKIVDPQLMLLRAKLEEAIKLHTVTWDRERNHQQQLLIKLLEEWKEYAMTNSCERGLRVDMVDHMVFLAKQFYTVTDLTEHAKETQKSLELPVNILSELVGFLPNMNEVEVQRALLDNTLSFLSNLSLVGGDISNLNKPADGLIVISSREIAGALVLEAKHRNIILENPEVQMVYTNFSQMDATMLVMSFIELQNQLLVHATEDNSFSAEAFAPVTKSRRELMLAYGKKTMLRIINLQLQSYVNKSGLSLTLNGAQDTSSVEYYEALVIALNQVMHFNDKNSRNRLLSVADCNKIKAIIKGMKPYMVILKGGVASEPVVQQKLEEVFYELAVKAFSYWEGVCYTVTVNKSSVVGEKETKVRSYPLYQLTPTTAKEVYKQYLGQSSYVEVQPSQSPIFEARQEQHNEALRKPPAFLAKGFKMKTKHESLSELLQQLRLEEPRNNTVAAAEEAAFYRANHDNNYKLNPESVKNNMVVTKQDAVSAESQKLQQELQEHLTFINGYVITEGEKRVVTPPPSINGVASEYKPYPPNTKYKKTYESGDSIDKELRGRYQRTLVLKQELETLSAASDFTCLESQVVKNFKNIVLTGQTVSTTAVLAWRKYCGLYNYTEGYKDLMVDGQLTDKGIRNLQKFWSLYRRQDMPESGQTNPYLVLELFEYYSYLSMVRRKGILVYENPRETNAFLDPLTLYRSLKIDSRGRFYYKGMASSTECIFSRGFLTSNSYEVTEETVTHLYAAAASLLKVDKTHNTVYKKALWYSELSSSDVLKAYLKRDTVEQSHLFFFLTELDRLVLGVRTDLGIEVDATNSGIQLIAGVMGHRELLNASNILNTDPKVKMDNVEFQKVLDVLTLGFLKEGKKFTPEQIKAVLHGTEFEDTYTLVLEKLVAMGFAKKVVNLPGVSSIKELREVLSMNSCLTAVRIECYTKSKSKSPEVQKEVEEFNLTPEENTIKLSDQFGPVFAAYLMSAKPVVGRNQAKVEVLKYHLPFELMKSWSKLEKPVAGESNKYKAAENLKKLPRSFFDDMVIDMIKGGSFGRNLIKFIVVRFLYGQGTEGGQQEIKRYLKENKIQTTFNFKVNGVELQMDMLELSDSALHRLALSIRSHFDEVIEKHFPDLLKFMLACRTLAMYSLNLLELNNGVYLQAPNYAHLHLSYPLKTLTKFTSSRGKEGSNEHARMLAKKAGKELPVGRTLTTFTASILQRVKHELLENQMRYDQDISRWIRMYASTLIHSADSRVINQVSFDLALHYQVYLGMTHDSLRLAPDKFMPAVRSYTLALQEATRVIREVQLPQLYREYAMYNVEHTKRLLENGTLKSTPALLAQLELVTAFQGYSKNNNNFLDMSQLDNVRFGLPLSHK